MTVHLASIVDTYFADTAFQDNSRKVIAKRENSIPTFKQIVTKFVDGDTDLKILRNDLNKALFTEESWGATGTDFLMELNKLSKNHADSSNITETELRKILTGLSASNLGQRIEQFWTFLAKEKTRLLQAGKTHGQIVFQGNSAIIISLFAFWLDRPGYPIIYYVSLRRGLKLLLDAGAIQKSTGLRIRSDKVEVRLDADHQAVLQALDSIAAAAPKLQAKTDPYWAERFLLWIDENPGVLEPETDDEKKVINHDPLRPTPATLLKRLIREIQHHILVDETLVKRIYHALLAGNVILTGPPGTGKTELARLIPEILWQSEETSGNGTNPNLSTRTAYTTMLVTATDEWSTRTLIGGIAPNIHSGQVSYRIQHGYLTNAILKNWQIDANDPINWQNPQRVSIQTPSILDSGKVQEYRGHWLIIDEFNRAPIDVALGEALTSLGGSGTLRVPVDSGSAELPLPKDFRIIGTLNSFDRNYLNQVSEALKRRFSFIEVLPPSRAQRDAEQAIVLYKSLKSIKHLYDDINVDKDGVLTWEFASSHDTNGKLVKQSYVKIVPVASGTYQLHWTPLPNQNQIQEAFNVGWDLFEIIRIYRQLGTAQAIALVRQMLITIVMEGYVDTEDCLKALDAALCDTCADQLQILLPDELDVLLFYLKLDKDTFFKKYNDFLIKLINTPRRLRAQVEALSAVVDSNGTSTFTYEDIERISEQEKPQIQANILTEVFHLDHPPFNLPQFTHRLQSFKTERGL